MSIDNNMQTVYDIMDMQKTISEIDAILQYNPLNAESARQKIFEINGSHPENVIIYKVLFSGGQSAPTIGFADDEQLRSDLSWKRYYLNAKCAGKTVDEMQRELFQK